MKMTNKDLLHFMDTSTHAKAIKIILGLESRVNIYSELKSGEKKSLSYIICFDLPCPKSEQVYFKNFVLSNLVQFGITANKVVFTKNKFVMTVPFEVLINFAQALKTMVNQPSQETK
jgi:hypothetical protein